jgi:hypothetical protein
MINSPVRWYALGGPVLLNLRRPKTKENSISLCKVTKLENSRLTHLSEAKIMRNNGVEFSATSGDKRKLNFNINIK